MAKTAQLTDNVLLLRTKAPSIYIDYSHKEIARLTKYVEQLRQDYAQAEQNGELMRLIVIKEDAEYTKAMIKLYQEEIVIE